MWSAYIFLFSRSLCTSSAWLFLFTWSSTTSGTNKYLPAETWRPAVYGLFLAIVLSAVSFRWWASFSRFIPFLAFSWLRYCTTWSTRVPVIPSCHNFSRDGGMKEKNWLIIVCFCLYIQYLSVAFPGGATSCSSMDPTLFSNSFLVVAIWSFETRSTTSSFSAANAAWRLSFLSV